MRLVLFMLALSSSLAIAQPSPPRVTVTMSAATLADDCGQPTAAPTAPPAAPKIKADPAEPDVRSRGAKAKRACEQTSMQFTIDVPKGVASTTFRVKKVELFDDAGKSLGELTPRGPTSWSDKAGAYQPWNEKLATGTIMASYALSAPKWGGVAGRWNKTYTVKAVVMIGGAQQALNHEVRVGAQTSLPPNVKT